MTNRANSTLQYCVNLYFKFLCFGYFATLRFAQYDEVVANFTMTGISRFDSRFAEVDCFGLKPSQ